MMSRKSGTASQCTDLKDRGCLRDFKHDVCAAGGWSGNEAGAPYAAELFHGTLRTPVIFTDPKHHCFHKTKCVAHHQTLDLAIGISTPMSADQKGPADFDLASRGIVAVV